MGKLYSSIAQFVLLCGLLTCLPPRLQAQCTTSAPCGGNTNSGATCQRGNFYYGEIAASNGCANFTTATGFGPGEYFRTPVLQGACYTISTCGAPIDTQINCFQGTNTTAPFSKNDDNGPVCTGVDASVRFTPNFTDYTRVSVRQFNCQAGGTASINVLVRQNNNLNITSSASDMCAGQTRTLTANPTPVTVNPPANAGNTGTFSGPGVVGNVFTAPSPSGNTGTVTITYDFGFCCTTQDITVWRPPSGANAGLNQSVCAASATITGNTPTFGNGQWSVVTGPGVIANPNSPVTTINGLVQGQSTTLYWTITNGPCTAEIDSIVVTREVEPNPANAGADQAICADNTTLTGNAPSIGQGTWSLLGGSGTVTNSTSATSTVTGLGFGPNTFVWNIASGACTVNADTVVITRDAVPTTAAAGADLFTCDSTVILNANAPAIGAGQWNLIGGSGNFANNADPNTALSGLAVGPATLSWTISNGVCPPSIDTLQVTRNAQPALPLVNGTLQVCAGGGTALTATSGATNPSFVWWDAASGGNSLAATSVFNTGALTTTTSYWVNVTDGATNCTSERQQVTVTVNPLPNVNLGADTSACIGDVTCLDAGPGFAGYQWQPNGDTTQIACFTGAASAVVTVTDGNGCQGSDTLVITGIPTPQVNLGPDVDVCPGNSVMIGIPPQAGSSYLWSNGDTSSMTTVSQPGTYFLICSDSTGCTGSDTIEVNQLPATMAAFTTDTSNCPNIGFTDNSMNATSWSWSFGDGSGVSLNQNTSYNYNTAGNGTYTVTLISTGQCGSDTTTQTIIIDCVVGVQLPSRLSINVFPNPNHGTFQVEFTGMEEDATLKVFSTSGQLVYHRDIRDQRGDFRETVELQRPAAGIYFIQLEIGGVQISKRIMVE
ncbi:MAG: T9SS type A sorting domain-containing protein [Bacteroidota bacterium]